MTMRHGYCKTNSEGEVTLAFTPTAWALDALHAMLVHELVEAKEGDQIVGYSLHQLGQGNGYLYYPRDGNLVKAKADQWSSDAYEWCCTALTVGGVV